MDPVQRASLPIQVFIAEKVPELLILKPDLSVKGIQDCTSPNALSCKRVTVDRNVLRTSDSLSVLSMAVLKKDTVMDVNEHKDLFEFNVREQVAVLHQQKVFPFTFQG